MSRENYERLLRRLVRKSSGRIRWLAGTVIGLKMASDPSVIQSVSVRIRDGLERGIPASLVIGEYVSLQIFDYTYELLCADCTGPSQAGLKWLKCIYQIKAIHARSSSLPFDDLRLQYKTVGRYKSFRIYVPISSRSRLPIPGGYDKAGVIIFYAGAKRCNIVINRIEGHRSMNFPIPNSQQATDV